MTVHEARLRIQRRVDEALLEELGAAGSIPMKWVIVLETADSGTTERTLHAVYSDSMATWDKVGFAEMLKISATDEIYSNEVDEEEDE